MKEVARRIKKASQPLTPTATGVEPKLERLEGVRAVVFDVYGTLLISASGDISLTSGAAHARAAEQAFEAIGHGAVDGEQVIVLLKQTIERHHQESSQQYPEVEICDVWRDVLTELGLRVDSHVLPLLAVEYECRVNPVWPMPGLGECLNACRRGGLLLGIVSNAQFFTPLAFAGLTGRSLETWGFEQDLCVWSYAQRHAKPGVGLYEMSRSALAQRGVSADQALYVGNDLRNDVWPAQRVGMRTALFAGDARSLRLREDDPRVAGTQADVVITELQQLITVLALAAG